MTTSTPESSAGEASLAAKVCREYYLERRTKQEIAADIGVSRFKVARLIEHAHALGLVEITVKDPELRDTAAEEALRTTYGLSHAVVARPPTDDDLVAALGAAAAELLRELLSAGDVLGIGWGSSVRETVGRLADVTVATPVDVVQLSGGFRSADGLSSAVAVASEAAEILGGALYPLHAPAFVDTPAARESLLRQPEISDTFVMFESMTVSVQGIGSAHSAPDSLLYQAAALAAEDSGAFRTRAAGDVFCYIIDDDGHELADVAQRTITIPRPTLLGVPVRIGVAGGAAKSSAISAAIAGGWINALVTDTTAADRLLGRTLGEHPRALKR